MEFRGIGKGICMSMKRVMRCKSERPSASLAWVQGVAEGPHLVGGCLSSHNLEQERATVSSECLLDLEAMCYCPIPWLRRWISCGES